MTKKKTSKKSAKKSTRKGGSSGKTAEKSPSKNTKKISTSKSTRKSSAKGGKKPATRKSPAAKSSGKKSRIKKAKLQEIRDMLLERRKALVEGVLEEYSEVVNRSRTMIGDSTDIAQDLSEESVSLGILANEEEELDQIEAALNRIDEGTYGMCEKCGEPIPVKRLSFLPYATKCVKCKSMEEQEGGETDYSPRFSFGAVEDVSEDDEEDED